MSKKKFKCVCGNHKIVVWTDDDCNINVVSLKTTMMALPKVTVGRVGLLAVHPEEEIMCALVRDNRGWIVYCWDLRK